MKAWILTIFLSPTLVFAQDLNGNDEVSRVADDLTAFPDEDNNYDDKYENYLQLVSNPIDLNKVSRAELEMLNLLTQEQVTQFLQYRDTFGDFISIYELQAVPGFTLRDVESLLPFVKLTDPQSSLDRKFLKRLSTSSNTYLVTRIERVLQESKGFSLPADSNGFQGSSEKYYTRFRSSIPHDYSIGFTSEKDAGEKFQWNPKDQQYGFDYVSVHLQLQNKGKFDNIVIGDYQAQFGHGITLGTAFGLGKGGETVNTLKRPAIGFVPYTSANENGFLRGAAFTYRLHPKVKISLCYSGQKRDASINEDENLSISSLTLTGLHRNSGELFKRKTISTKDYGVIFGYEDKNFSVGMIGHHVEFEYPINKKPTVYNQFTFEGKANTTVSTYWNWHTRNFTFFGEGGRSSSGGLGLVAGVLTNISLKTDVGLLFRKYDRDFHTFYGNAFSENTSPQNETGIYWGLKHQFSRKVVVTAYADLFQFPWLKFRVYRPSAGKEILTRLNYQPSKKIILFIQGRLETKDRNKGETDAEFHQVARGKKFNISFNADYSPTSVLRMRTRVQYSEYHFNKATTNGILLLQDLIYTNRKFQFTFRHGIFDTDDFDNRQYAFENDVWLAYSLPAYYGTGIRNYLIVKYKMNRMISLWVKYGHWRYTDKENIGSGMDLIEGNQKSDLKLQIRFTL